MNSPRGAAATRSGNSDSAYVSPNALYVPSAVNTATSPSMSPWLIVTAYRASSWLISTTSATRPSASKEPSKLKDLPALHHEPHVLSDGDVLQRIPGHADHIGQQPRRQPPPVRNVDQRRRDHGRGPQHGQGRH